MRQRQVPRSFRTTVNHRHNRNGPDHRHVTTITHRHRQPSAATARIRWRKMQNCLRTKPKSNNSKWKTKDVFSTTNSSIWCPITWFSRKEISATSFPSNSIWLPASQPLQPLPNANLTKAELVQFFSKPKIIFPINCMPLHLGVRILPLCKGIFISFSPKYCNLICMQNDDRRLWEFSSRLKIVNLFLSTYA